MQVTADGSLLMIQARDCSLSEILDAVRAKTGANIDVSGRTGEHMTVKIGPGPARQVISSLLGWTEFDYVIQGADSDSVAIQSIMLFPKTKASPVPATAAPPMGPNRQPLAGQMRPAAPEPTPAPTEQPEPEAAAPAAQQPQQPAADNPAISAIPTNYERSPANAENGAAPSAQGKNTGEMIQDMQQLFEQRKQIQMEHNQTPGAAPLPSH